MTRRAAGAVLCVAVLLGSLVIARIGGIRVGGTPIGLPGSGVPAVGECLIDINGPLSIAFHAALPPSPVSVTGIGAPSVRFSDCVAGHLGEVVAYRRTPGSGAGDDRSADPAAAAAAATTSMSDSEWCRDVAAGFRSHTNWRFRSAADGLWLPATGERFVAILSAPTLDSKQARWAACAVVSPGLESYTGSYVQSLADRPTPAPFGLCRSGGYPDRWVSCVAPHRVQEFGTAAGHGMSARVAVDTCRSLIARMTGLVDVNGGGRLRVEVIGGGPPSRGSDTGGSDTRGVDVGGLATNPVDVGRCRLSVVGPHQLAGTLIGIGDRPLPLA